MTSAPSSLCDTQPIEEKLREVDLRDGCGKGELVLAASPEALCAQQKHAHT